MRKSKSSCWKTTSQTNSESVSCHNFCSRALSLITTHRINLTNQHISFVSLPAAAEPASRRTRLSIGTARCVRTLLGLPVFTSSPSFFFFNLPFALVGRRWDGRPGRRLACLSAVFILCDRYTTRQPTSERTRDTEPERR